jgi:hypothetical protein
MLLLAFAGFGKDIYIAHYMINFAYHKSKHKA